MIQSLFDYSEGNIVKPTPYAMSIKAFRDVVKHSKDNDEAVMKLSYVFFYADTRSPYKNYTDSSKDESIKKIIGFSSKWKSDKYVKKAIEVYEEYSSDASVRGLDEMRKSIAVIGSVTMVLRRNIEAAMEDINEEEGEPERLENVLAMISSLMEIVSKVPKITEALEATVERVSSLFSVSMNEEGTYLNENYISSEIGYKIEE